MLVHRRKVEPKREEARVDGRSRLLAADEHLLKLLLKVAECEKHLPLLALSKLCSECLFGPGEPQGGQALSELSIVSVVEAAVERSDRATKRRAPICQRAARRPEERAVARRRLGEALLSEVEQRQSVVEDLMEIELESSIGDSTTIATREPARTRRRVSGDHARRTQ